MPSTLISGANRGLGLEFARQYSSEAWQVIAQVRHLDTGAAIASSEGKVEIQLLDMAQRKTIAALADNLRRRPIDVLICNAAIHGPARSDFRDIDYAAWLEVFNVNVLGQVALVEALADNVALSEAKKIVMISSVSGSITNNDGGDYIYRSSKAALNCVTRGLAADLRDRGITVLAVSPGWAPRIWEAELRL